MVDNSSGANIFLSFLLGVVLMAVGIVGFFMWDNYKAHSGGDINISLNVKHR